MQKKLHHRVGIKASYETREKQRQAHLGKKNKPESIIKMIATRKRNGLPGYWAGKKRLPFTDEHKRRIGKAQIGKIISKEAIEKQKLKMTGRSLTEEHRRNIGLSMSKYVLTGKHIFWKGGINKENHKIRNSVDYKLWRLSVYKRDRYLCTECGCKGNGNLNAHHIKPFAYYPELRFDINNGTTLCIPCHKKTESYMNSYGSNQYVKRRPKEVINNNTADLNLIYGIK